MIPYRYAEAAALVPLLHMRPGPTMVRVAGPQATLLAAEALRWRDTTEVWSDQPLPIKDSRVKLVPAKEMFNHSNFFDVVLLSPDMDPEPFMSLLKKGGIIQSATTAADKLPALRVQIKALTGAAVPYREYTPEPIWFVIGAVGSTPRRVRRPPDGARRITERFLPALFSFGKDELPAVFGPGEKP
jgi:hypothetical protein